MQIFHFCPRNLFLSFSCEVGSQPIIITIRTLLNIARYDYNTKGNMTFSNIMSFAYNWNRFFEQSKNRTGHSSLSEKRARWFLTTTTLSPLSFLFEALHPFDCSCRESIAFVLSHSMFGKLVTLVSLSCKIWDYCRCHCSLQRIWSMRQIVIISEVFTQSFFGSMK